MSPLEAIARRLYAYDNERGVPFDEADADLLSPYFDMAELALQATGEAS